MKQKPRGECRGAFCSCRLELAALCGRGAPIVGRDRGTGSGEAVELRPEPEDFREQALRHMHPAIPGLDKEGARLVVHVLCSADR